MDLIPLICPNCNGRIEAQGAKKFKCPFCETELLLKENNVYYVDQTINNYYGKQPKALPAAAVKMLVAATLVIAGALAIYLFSSLSPSGIKMASQPPVRTMPESEVLLSFVREIYNKGSALPTEEELAQIRYLDVSYADNQWQFKYSFDDPFSNGQPAIRTYTTKDKMLNTQRIEQKDFEAFSGLAALELNNTYEISPSDFTSYAHMKGLKSYGGRFNESFSAFANYFGDKSQIVTLATQIRSNQELALLLEFPNLKSLAITYVDESVSDFYLLGQLPLESLSLTFVNQLEWLSSLSGLQSLTIAYSEAVDFSPLYALTQLQELRLAALPNVKTIDFVQNMPALQTLDLQQMQLANLDLLAGKTSITKLRLASLGNLDSVAFVNSLASLKELALIGYYADAVPLALPNATRVEVPGAFIPGLEAPALTSLTFAGLRAELPGSDLVKFPRLEQLTVRETSEFSDIRALDGLPSLQTLSFDDVSFYEETDALFSLQHVKHLTCTECTLKIGAQDTVANGSLEHLALNDTRFLLDNNSVHEADKVMPYFAGLAGLRSFTMQDSTIASLEFMGNWQAIEELDLANNAIANIEPLSRLPQLQKVQLTGNPVQNKSLLGPNVKVY